MLIWGIVGIALPLKYLVVLPYLLGWMDPDFVLPGFVVVLGNLSLLSLFLLLYYAWTRNALLYIPAAAAPAPRRIRCPRRPTAVRART